MLFTAVYGSNWQSRTELWKDIHIVYIKAIVHCRGHLQGFFNVVRFSKEKIGGNAWMDVPFQISEALWGSGHGPTWDWDKKELQLDWIEYYVIRNGLICFQVSSISV